MMIDIIEVLSLDGYIMYNKQLAKLFGIECAILIGELCSEYKYWKNSGKLTKSDEFFSTAENIENNTCLSAYQQRKAIEKLTEANILEVTRKGMPAQNYFKINQEQLLKNFTSSCEKTSHQDVKKLHLNNNKNNNIDNTSTKVDVQPKVDTEEKPKKKNLYEKCADMIELYCAVDDDRLKAILLDYLPVRLANKEKPLRGANEWKGMLSKLFKMSESQDVLVEIVEDSMANGWACFVNPKEKKSFKKKDKQEIFGEHGQVFSDKSGGELADVIF